MKEAANGPAQEAANGAMRTVGGDPPRARDLGGGLWSVPVPIPGNPLGYTLVYVLESRRGPVLIDAGWQHAESWSALRSGLEGFGIDMADVYGVVVTHYHPDHAGLAGRVREASGAWIAMHHADAEVIRRFRSVVRSADLRAFELDSLRRAGASEAELAETGGAGSRRANRVDPPAEPDRELDDGDLADVPGRRLRVVWTPGHSPGHICLHLEDAGRLFTGDHVLPAITPHIGLYPYDVPDVDPLSDYLSSLHKVAELGVADALPAHEYGFSGIRDRAKALVEHHEERLDQVRALLSARPRTLWDIAAHMRWNQPWQDMELIARRMATGEAASHLRTLERRGQARRHGSAERLEFVSAAA